jgi:hypothetical protein
MKTKIFGCIAVLIALFAGVAFAQSTRCITSRFSATFNGSVSLDTDVNDQKTATLNKWSSSGNGVFQMLTIRDISDPINVNQASLDYYVNQVLDGTSPIERTNCVYQGYICSYVHYNADDTQWRLRFIIVNPHTVFILSELTDIGRDDSVAWATFSNSLRIK